MRRRIKFSLQPPNEGSFEQVFTHSMKFGLSSPIEHEIRGRKGRSLIKFSMKDWGRGRDDTIKDDTIKDDNIKDGTL